MFLFSGGMALLGAALDWDWFMNHRKVRFFVTAFGRFGARLMYGVLGLVLFGLGCAILSGWMRVP
jgi:hypothetical protein